MHKTPAILKRIGRYLEEHIWTKPSMTDPSRSTAPIDTSIRTVVFVMVRAKKKEETS